MISRLKSAVKVDEISQFLALTKIVESLLAIVEKVGDAGVRVRSLKFDGPDRKSYDLSIKRYGRKNLRYGVAAE